MYDQFCKKINIILSEIEIYQNYTQLYTQLNDYLVGRHACYTAIVIIAG